MQKVLITGASGFVGGFLVEEALNRGMQVYAAIRKSSSKEYLKDDRISFIYIDFENQASLNEIFRTYTFDYVIHNAGLTKAKKKEAYFKVNHTYLKNLVEGMSHLQKPLKKLLFVSSLAAYGPAEYSKEGFVQENDTPHPVTNYGRSKLAAEQFLKSQNQVPYTIIRPTAVYGPREWDLFTVYEIINKGLNLMVGMKDQKLTFIYVKDLVRVIIDATAEKSVNNAYFVSDLKEYSSSKYNESIKNALGKKALKIRLPILGVKVIAAFSELAGKIMGKYPALNLEKVNELEAKSWAIDTKPLVNNLNFVPEYDLEKGLKESIAWYRSKNLLK